MIIKLEIEEARVLQLLVYLAKDSSIGTWELLKDIKEQLNEQVPPEVISPAPED